jgi:hypothetical protein
LFETGTGNLLQTQLSFSQSSSNKTIQIVDTKISSSSNKNTSRSSNSSNSTQNKYPTLSSSASKYLEFSSSSFSTSSFAPQFSSSNNNGRKSRSSNSSSFFNVGLSLKERFSRKTTTNPSEVLFGSNFNKQEEETTSQNLWITPKPKSSTSNVIKVLPEEKEDLVTESEEEEQTNIYFPSQKSNDNCDMDDEISENSTQILNKPTKIIYKYDDDEDVDTSSRPVQTVFLNWDQLKEKMKQNKTKKEQEDEGLHNSYAQKFRAKISPGENSTAEQELGKQLKKEDFSKVQKKIQNKIHVNVKNE